MIVDFLIGVLVGYLMVCALMGMPVWNWMIMEETGLEGRPKNLYELAWYITFIIGIIIWSPFYIAIFVIMGISRLLKKIKL